MADDKPKKQRKPRRNYERELRELESYIRVYVEVLKENGGGVGDMALGQIDAFNKVLAKIGGKS